MTIYLTQWKSYRKKHKDSPLWTRLQKTVRWHIKKFTTLQKEVYDLRNEKVDSEKFIADSTCKCKSSNIASSSNCEKCKHLQWKIDYLAKTLAKLTSGRTNLYVILSSQKCVMSRVGLRYGLGRKQKTYKSFFNLSTPSTSSFISCH